MTSATASVWLARRFVGVSRRPSSSTMVLVLGAALLTVLLLATLAVPQARHAQRDRVRALTPELVLSDRGTGFQDGRLLTLDPQFTPVRRWNGHEITRRYYAENGSKVAIPGTPRAPAVNQYYASPDLERLIRTDPVVSALFDRLERKGTLSSEGLVQPHELRAVIGVSKQHPFLHPVSRFGSDQPTASASDNSVLNIAVSIMVLLAVWLPGIAFLFIICRLSSRQRQRRARSLRLLGLSVAETRFVHVLESATVTFVGAVAGSATYFALARSVTEVPGIASGYWRSDVSLSPLLHLGAPLIVALVAGLITAASLELGSGEAPSIRPPAGRWGKLGAAVFAVGLLYLVTAPALAAALDSGLVALGFWVACGLVAGGLAVAGPRIVTVVTSVWARRVRSASALVGLRIVSWSTSTATRLGSVFCVVIILMLGSLSFMAILNGGGTSSWTDALKASPRVPLVVTDITGTVSRHDVAEAHHGGLAQTREIAVEGRQVTVVYAACDDLAELSGAPLVACTDEPQWLAVRGARPAPPALRSKQLKLGPGNSVSVPPASDVAEAVGLPSGVSGALLLPPRLAPKDPVGDGSTFLMLVDNDELRLTLAELGSLSPMIQFDYGDVQWADPDRHQFPGQLRWLTVGAVLSLLVGSFALLAATLGDAPDRAARLRGLQVLGASRRRLVAAHVWATAVPITVLGWIATSSGWLVCRSMNAFDDRASLPIGALCLTVLMVPTASILISAATAVDTLRPKSSRASS